MKTIHALKESKSRKLWAVIMVYATALATAAAQLAITEVMSSAATNHGGIVIGPGSDYWELTNFGTNEINLTNYSFTDVADQPRVKECFNGLILGPGESAIFFRNKPGTRVITEAQFREWWGPCLGPNVQVRSFLTPGFDNVEDCVRLLDPDGQVVDRVCFGRARDGASFVYDTDCGEFGAVSAPGDGVTCQAADADDIGSPGSTRGPVPLRITAQPFSLSNLCAGADALFCVQACGLPRPRYQWQFNGADIPGANAACLTVASAQSGNNGQYQVIVSNGLKMVLSAPVYLAVDTNPSPPHLLSELRDLERFVGEKAEFTIQVCAPQARLQWSTNGVLIPDATNRTLLFPSVTPAISGVTCRVDIVNTLGAISNSARLWVYPTPQLEISEVMPAPDTNAPGALHANWFELTNRGTNSVRLHMLQHSDRYSLVGAKGVTEHLELLPQESAIFVEEMTREAFIVWWGASNLPPGLKVVTYHGYGLSPWSDCVYIWSATAESVIGAFASVGWASPSPPPASPTCPCHCDPELCGHSIYGHSLFFDQRDTCAYDGRASQENINGAFHSLQADDVGSPGFAWNPVILSTRRNGSVIEMKHRVIAGKLYRLEATDQLPSSSWMDLGSYAASSSTLTTTNIPGAGRPQRFYRLRELP